LKAFLFYQKNAPGMLLLSQRAGSENVALTR